MNYDFSEIIHRFVPKACIQHPKERKNKEEIGSFTCSLRIIFKQRVLVFHDMVIGFIGSLRNLPYQLFFLLFCSPTGDTGEDWML